MIRTKKTLNSKEERRIDSSKKKRRESNEREIHSRKRCERNEPIRNKIKGSNMYGKDDISTRFRRRKGCQSVI
jgi:hypothetical protein